MPMSPEQASLINAGATVAGQGINAIAQGNINKRTQRWNEQMYARQRADALMDFKNMNDYNHPSAVMARLREAGLNPNLVYGNGNAANSAAPIRNTDSGAWNPRAPQFDLGAAASSGLGAYFDVQTRQAQVDNLRAQNTVYEQEALLKAAQIAATLAGTDNTRQNTLMSQFDLGQKSQLSQYVVEAAKANLEKTRADTQMTLSSNERAAAMLQPNLIKAAEEILNMRLQRARTREEIIQIRAQVENLKRDGTLKDLDTQLRKLGVNPNDPWYFRVLGQAVNNPLPKFKPGSTNATFHGMQHMFPLLRGLK